MVVCVRRETVGGKGRKGRWRRRVDSREDEVASRERKRRRRATRVVMTPLKQLWGSETGENVRIAQQLDEEKGRRVPQVALD
jgi:hypothetical protein